MSRITATKKGSMLIFQNDEGDVVQYDLKDGTNYKLSKKGELRPVQSLNDFFVNTEPRQLSDWFDDKNYAKFIKKVASGEGRCTNTGTLLNRLRHYSYLENYILLGIEVDYDVKIPSSKFPIEVLRFFADNNIRLTSYTARYFNYNPELYSNIIRYIVAKYNDEQEIKNKIYNLLSSYNFDDFKRLVNDYNYEYKRLIEYLLYIDNFEALQISSALQQLRDYAQMQKAMSANGKFEKYPRYLRTTHDIVARNHNAFKKQYSESMFASRINKDLEYLEDRYYKVVLPTCTEDLKQEGVNLHHCVGSYVDRVISGETQIVFLREEVDKSLVTVEVKNGRINQARGLYNRPISKDEEEFLKKYCNIKNLKFKDEY